MAEWLVEEGIGEERAILLDGDEIVAARLHWPGGLACGEVAEAQVIERLPTGSASAIARTAAGEEVFVRRSPAADSVGRTITVLIEREAMAERGRLKRAQGTRTDAAPRPAPSLAAQLRETGAAVRVVPRFPAAADWPGLFAEAWEGAVPFSGGALLLADTPAMTLVDVDGGPPEAIFHNAVPALAAALRRLDIGGNIGVDFPTLPDKGDRRAVDAALARALDGRPHERTAMNGFGFVQIVTRLARPSLLRRIARDRAGAAARALLRQAEDVAQPGALLLVAHPAVLAAIHADWLAELARRTGRPIRQQAQATLALNGGFAQAVPL